MYFLGWSFSYLMKFVIMVYEREFFVLRQHFNPAVLFNQLSLKLAMTLCLP